MKATNILLIDDNDVDNYITRQMLLKNKVAGNIVVQSSAMDALKYLQSNLNEPVNYPDYIFLDIRMPEMDGFDFLNEYAKFPVSITNHCIIFMLTSSADQNDILRAAQNPLVKKYLNKPLSHQVLSEIWPA
jgi:CheY-like chemotaxis protein